MELLQRSRKPLWLAMPFSKAACERNWRPSRQKGNQFLHPPSRQFEQKSINLLNASQKSGLLAFLMLRINTFIVPAQPPWFLSLFYNWNPIVVSMRQNGETKIKPPVPVSFIHTEPNTTAWIPENTSCRSEDLLISCRGQSKHQT